MAENDKDAKSTINSALIAIETMKSEHGDDTRTKEEIIEQIRENIEFARSRIENQSDPTFVLVFFRHFWILPQELMNLVWLCSSGREYCTKKEVYSIIEDIEKFINGMVGGDNAK